MKLSWLGPALLGSGAVASTLDAIGIDKLSSCESIIILGKAITYQRNGQLLNGDQDRRDSAPLQSPSVDSISVDVDGPPNVVSQRNQTHYKLYVPPPPQPPAHPASPPQHAPSTQQEHQKTETPAIDHDPEPAAEVEAETTLPELRSLVPANRAIAGMGAGLLSVMLIFTVFL